MSPALKEYIKDEDRRLIGDLRELLLLLSTEPVIPDQRRITSYLVYQLRIPLAGTVKDAINRILLAVNGEVTA